MWVLIVLERESGSQVLGEVWDSLDRSDQSSVELSLSASLVLSVLLALFRFLFWVNLRLFWDLGVKLQYFFRAGIELWLFWEKYSFFGAGLGSL